MPRYHFDLVIEGDLLPDPDGRSLPDADAAWEAARRIAASLLGGDIGPDVNWMRCLVVVRDEAGGTVLEYPFAEALPARGPPS